MHVSLSAIKVAMGWVQVLLVTIQFRMLHVLSYRTDSVTVILCVCEFGVLHQKQKEVIEGL